MARTSLTEIKRRYVLNGRPLDAATEAALRADTRAGAPRSPAISLEKRLARALLFLGGKEATR
jgi:hypothetical protein